jgi:glycosyltransferase involved in cell wall biosynthesis
MNKKKEVVAHILVKNEARFIWYSVSSIVNYVDKVLLWDTGSTDESLAIEKELVKKYPGKIIFKETPASQFDEEKIRQQMLDQTSSDWFVVIDADEIWWEDSMRNLLLEINNNGDKLESIVVPVVLPVGDIFHRQEESAGRYNLAGKTGHYNLRAVNRNIPGLHSLGVHGVWGWVDGEGRMIQDRDVSKIGYIDAPYLHMTYLERAGDGKDADVFKRKMKLKHEIGDPFPLDFYYPEVFFKDRPEFIPSPWRVMTKSFKFRAFFETPLRKIKRRIWKGRVGY